MPGIAPQLAARRTQQTRGVVVPAADVSSASGAMPGVPILQQQFPIGATQLNLQVEVAWGALISQPMVGWAWTDVTRDVQQAQKVSITIGRSDESSTPQPAQCAFVLKNPTGAYSYGPQSVNYPNVHKNVPIRISVWYQGVQYVRFLGYSTGFNPSWDVTGKYSTVNVTAAGVKRRLTQAVSPIQSVLRTAIPTLSGLLGYWPMEDGSASTQFANALGGLPMVILQGTGQLASNSLVTSSNPLPVMGTMEVQALVQNPTATGVAQMRFMVAMPAASSAAPDQSVIATMTTNGTLAEWYLLYHTGGSLSVVGYDWNDVKQFDSGAVGFNVDGLVGMISVSLTSGGGNVTVQIETYALGASGGGFANFTATGQNINFPTSIGLNDYGQCSNAAFGHAILANQYQDLFNLLSQVNGYRGEYAGPRISRLATQQGEYLNRLVGSSNQFMGVQTPDTLINLLEGCSAVELGYLYDGVNQGLTFIAQDQITSQNAAMTLDANLGQPAQPLTPLDDDRLTINEYTATRTNGSSAVWSDTYSPLAVGVIGEYSQSTSQDFYSDGEQLVDYAAWQVNVGTVNDYRWTPIVFWLHRDPELLTSWLTVTPMNRIDIVNLGLQRLQLANQTVKLLLEGYTETFDQFLWDVSANCSSYLPWLVAECVADVGDTNPFTMRLDSDGSTIVGSYPAGSTSLTVATPSGPLWTTVADDFPVNLTISGWEVQVTGITGSVSPQTFTTVPTVAPFTNGAAVTIWQSPVIDVIGF